MVEAPQTPTHLHPLPIDLGTGRTAVAVSAGMHHTCAILDNGELKCWGRDNYGQLGDGGGSTTITAPSSTAIDLGTGRTAVAVSARGDNTCAILDNGELKCWGGDNYGALGNGPTSTGNQQSPSSTPVDLGIGRTAVALDSSGMTTCVILDNGDVKCWGRDEYGHLGDGGNSQGAGTNTDAPPSTPIDLGTGRTAVAASSGFHHACAILDNVRPEVLGMGPLWTGGRWRNYLLGFGTTPNAGLPVLVAGNNSWDTTTTVVTWETHLLCRPA